MTESVRHRQPDQVVIDTLDQSSPPLPPPEYPYNSQQQQQQQAYTIQIPRFEHWPRLALHGIGQGAAVALNALSTIQEQFHAYRAKRRGDYGGLPSYAADEDEVDNLSELSPQGGGGRGGITPFASRRSRQQPLSFGGLRRHKQPKRGGLFGLFQFLAGRRLCLMQLIWLCLCLLIVLTTLPPGFLVDPLREQAWFRYYDHEEAIKVMLPLGMKVHVADVKMAVGDALSLDRTGHQLGEIKMLSGHIWRPLSPGDEWDNDSSEFKSSAERPIILIDTGYDPKANESIDDMTPFWTSRGNFLQRPDIDHSHLENGTWVGDTWEMTSEGEKSRLTRVPPPPMTLLPP
ncbi:hypothetical protein BGZ94_005698, partial [Podila epigama]